jgi:hypothetical protein
MELSKKQYFILFFAVISFILLIIVFKWIDFLTKNNYIRERFTNSDYDSHTVDLPLTTSYSCKNFCGPNATCSITGQQCSADIDCPGCQPYVPPLKSNDTCIPGDNDAGKLTLGVTPQYSTLTTDIGTQAKLVTKNKFSKPIEPNFGVNTWLSSFEDGDKLFNKRYKPPHLKYMPDYPPRYSLTGEFIEEGPLPSNAYLS